GDERIDGFLSLAGLARVALAGGNITKSPGPLIVDVTVSGFARRRHVLMRAGGRVGDDVYVTGDIGAAAAGLAYWKDARESKDTKEILGIEACVARHKRPEPRVRVGMLLGRNRA